jgi:hypothetical protein
MTRVTVRYDGPEQGLRLFEHDLRQSGLIVTAVRSDPRDRTPAPTVVCVLYGVGAADGRDDSRLPARVRDVVGRFARRYGRAGLDVVED